MDVPRAGPVGFGVDPAFAASASVPPGLPCAGAVDPSTALSVGCGAAPLDPKTEGRAGRIRRSVAERLIRLRSSRGRPSFKAFIRRRVWYARTPVSGGGTYRFSHGLFSPSRSLSSRGSSAAALGTSLPRFGHQWFLRSARAFRRICSATRGLRGWLRFGVCPGGELPLASSRPKPAAVVRRPPWGF